MPADKEELQDLNVLAAKKFRAALDADQSIPAVWKQAVLKLLEGDNESIQELLKESSSDPLETSPS